MAEYLGSLDDVVARWGHPDSPAEFVQTTLCEQVLYGLPGILNDGYLVQHPDLRALLIEGDQFLLELLRRDYLRLVSTRMPPSRSIEARAQGGVTSHYALTSSDNWQEIANAIDDLPVTSPKQGLWPSRDLTHGYLKLASDLLYRVREQGPSTIGIDGFEAFLSAFVDQLAEQPYAPRTMWEKMVRTVFSADVGRSAMDVGNVIYHVNFALLHAADTGSPPTLVTLNNAPLVAAVLGVPTHEQGRTMFEGRFLDVPTPTVEGLVTILEDNSLIELKGLWQREPADAARLRAYLDALDGMTYVRDMIVTPAASAAIQDGDDGEAFLTVVSHQVSGKISPYMRLGLPEAWSKAHADSTQRYGGPT